MEAKSSLSVHVVLQHLNPDKLRELSDALNEYTYYYLVTVQSCDAVRCEDMRNLTKVIAFNQDQLITALVLDDNVIRGLCMDSGFRRRHGVKLGINDDVHTMGHLFLMFADQTPIKEVGDYVRHRLDEKTLREEVLIGARKCGFLILYNNKFIMLHVEEGKLKPGKYKSNLYSY